MFENLVFFTDTDFEERISFHWNRFWGENEFSLKQILKWKSVLTRTDFEKEIILYWSFLLTKGNDKLKTEEKKLAPYATW